MRHHRKKTVPFVFISGLLASSLAQAAQLGKLEVRSGSDEPFLAEIVVDQVKPEERATLQAKLASAEAFKAARLTMDPKLKNLQFAVQDGKQAGTAVVKITSSQAMPAGFLDALVELTWAGGRVAREYTLSIPASAPKAAEAPTSLPEIKPPVIAPQPAEPKPEAPVQPSVPEKAAAEPFNVRKGDTLSELAQQLTGDGVTLNQAMAALYEANRGAFINNSVHLVREGAQLQVPNRAVLRSKNANEALIVLAQNDGRNVYSAYARQIGLLTVDNQAAAGAAGGGTSTQGSIAPKAADTKAANNDKADRLKLAPGTVAGKGSPDASAEELLAKSKALAEANERIALLEKNVSDLQRLLDMQKDLAQAPAVPPTVLPSTPADTPTEPPSAEPGLPVVEVPTEAAVAEPLPQNADEKPAEPAVEAPAAPVTPPVAEEEPFNWMPWALGGAGGLLLLVALLLVARARRNRSAKEEEAFVAEEPTLFSEVNEFDVAIAAAAAGIAAERESSLNKAENSDFDLDDVLNETAAQPRVEPARQAEAAVVETPPIQQADTAPPASELEIPELNHASEEAMQQKESLQSEVTLDFPEEEPAPASSNSILDDLDDMEKSTLAAQEELDEIRRQPVMTNPENEFGLVDSEDDASLAMDSTPGPQPDPEMVELQLDIPNPKADDATWQEVATKLDLAGAYVEIGDADGARELLNEILKKGDADQVRKAKALLGTLG